MTLVVGLVHGEQVYMGADSAEIEIHALTVRKDPQVFCKGRFLFGFPRFTRKAQILRYTLVPPDPMQEEPTQQEVPKPDKEIDHLMKFMIGTFVNTIVECLDKGRCPQEHEPAKPQEPAQAGQQETQRVPTDFFLVGCSGRLFTIASDYRVVEAADGYDVLGTVGNEIDAALGALFATRRDDDPQERVCKALHAAERLTGGVRPPFRVMCLGDDKYRECRDHQGKRTP